MKRSLLLLFFFVVIFSSIPAQHPVHDPLPPDMVYGRLFTDVQLNRVFPDNKTFVDCIPKKDPAEIITAYRKVGANPPAGFSLSAFITDNFILPASPTAYDNIRKENTAEGHIKALWSVLQREATKEDKGEPAWKKGSLLPLPYSYIVPGGRFREIYYWDSYFTMLGLKESGREDIIENMVRNFSYLIETYGHIPNGNRSYYLSRSQPPFYNLMVQLLAGIKGDEVYKTCLPALKKEYDYWTDRSAVTHHNVVMPDGSLLSRYYDRDDIPRQESYVQDYTLSKNLPPAKATVMNRNLRSGAESGWDFSSRWFADGKNIASIQTTDIIPVDLNALLYQLEMTIAKASQIVNDIKSATSFEVKAGKRMAAIEKYCWNENKGYYFDYNTKTKQQTTIITPAGMFPLCLLNLPEEKLKEKGNKAAKIITENLLKDGGIVTTTNTTGQQWDAPNGWAPLQWMTVWGLDRSGHKDLALDIARRWTSLNEHVYAGTGKMMEKYNVVNIHLEAGGGEYPGQDGFGWTNGVYLAMKKMLQEDNTR